MDKENIRILDQNINDGIDVRTYRVSFEKIKKVFPGFETNWTVKKGIKTIFEKFEEIYGFSYAKIEDDLQKAVMLKYSETPNIDWEKFSKGCY